MSDHTRVYRARLEEFLHTRRIYRSGGPSGSMMVARDNIIIHGYRTVVYGCGRDVDIFLNYLLDEGICAECIVDRDEKLGGAP